MNLGDTHRRHEKDVRTMKEKVQLMIVGKRYFKDKSPNFLTYNEKEQIRTLHEEDSEKWTVDKLSGMLQLVKNVRKIAVHEAHFPVSPCPPPQPKK